TLSGEMLKNRAGSDLVHVPYKGISLAVPAVMAGEVQLTFAGIATSMPQLKAGRIKPIAIGGAERSPLHPHAATLSELRYLLAQALASAARSAYVQRARLSGSRDPRLVRVLPAGRIPSRCGRQDSHRCKACP